MPVEGRFHRLAHSAGWALLLVLAPLLGSTPPLLDEATRDFRGDAPRGWSYTQRTTGAGHSMVERYEAAQPEFNRWSLLEQDDRLPSADEVRTYREGRSRRSRTGTAPLLVQQLLLESAEMLSENTERATFRCRLRPGEARDRTAEFLRATLVIHKASRTVESVELANVAPFSPAVGVRITEMTTRLSYSLPDGDRPSLPLQVSTRVRGRAFWLVSLDEEMTVAFSGHARARP
jgi:hypothetical protein